MIVQPREVDNITIKLSKFIEAEKEVSDDHEGNTFVFTEKDLLAKNINTTSLGTVSDGRR